MLVISQEFDTTASLSVSYMQNLALSFLALNGSTCVQEILASGDEDSVIPFKYVNVQNKTKQYLYLHARFGVSHDRK